jgi:hypothetical protein
MKNLIELLADMGTMLGLAAVFVGPVVVFIATHKPPIC